MEGQPVPFPRKKGTLWPAYFHGEGETPVIGVPPEPSLPVASEIEHMLNTQFSAGANEAVIHVGHIRYTPSDALTALKRALRSANEQKKSLRFQNFVDNEYAAQILKLIGIDPSAIDQIPREEAG